MTDITALGDHWLAFGKRDEKGGLGFLVSARFMALTTADMYIRGGVNASDK
ncbi:MAG TPA: hypothetical protein VEK84_16170 [Terriglobales bacterium]|nr:hypothetical protein [Terriglobales bacterium]